MKQIVRFLLLALALLTMTRCSVSEQELIPDNPARMSQDWAVFHYIRAAVGEHGQISPRINADNFPSASCSLTTSRFELQPFRRDENVQTASERLEREGFILADMCDLAVFLVDNFPTDPLITIFATAKSSLLTDSVGTHAPYAGLSLGERYFGLSYMRGTLNIPRILVSRPQS